jgi:hypothetical protein
MGIGTYYYLSVLIGSINFWSAFLVAIFMGSILIYYISIACYNENILNDDKKEYKPPKLLFKVVFFLILVSVLTPSKKDILIIAISNKAEKYAVSGEAKKDVISLLDEIDKRLLKYLDKEENEDAK